MEGAEIELCRFRAGGGIDPRYAPLLRTGGSVAVEGEDEDGGGGRRQTRGNGGARFQLDLQVRGQPTAPKPCRLVRTAETGEAGHGLIHRFPGAVVFEPEIRSDDEHVQTGAAIDPSRRRLHRRDPVGDPDGLRLFRDRTPHRQIGQGSRNFLGPLLGRETPDVHLVDRRRIVEPYEQQPIAPPLPIEGDDVGDGPIALLLRTALDEFGRIDHDGLHTRRQTGLRPEQHDSGDGEPPPSRRAQMTAFQHPRPLPCRHLS